MCCGVNCFITKREILELFPDLISKFRPKFRYLSLLHRRAVRQGNQLNSVASTRSIVFYPVIGIEHIK